MHPRTRLRIVPAILALAVLLAGCRGGDPGDVAIAFRTLELEGVDLATDFAFVPGTDDEILVLTQPGQVHHLRIGRRSAKRLGMTSLSGVHAGFGCGLLSLAFDPGFATNRYVYLGYCASAATSRLTRHRLDSLAALAPTAVEILEVSSDTAPLESWHRWGSMGFEPDGETLWVLLGDHFDRANGQDVSEKFGSLLRLIPARKEGKSGFTPARGNAFQPPAGDPAVYAHGFRSPWRGTRDRHGRFWVGDVGLADAEEVNLVTAAGQNFGWARAEGPCRRDCAGLTDPVAHWGRVGTHRYASEDPRAVPDSRRTVWLGEVYESPRDRYAGRFDGMLVFGDFFNGWVRGLRVGATGKVESDVPLGHLSGVTAWRAGPDGYIYALTIAGQLNRLLP